jgi:hypothetical protein
MSYYVYVLIDPTEGNRVFYVGAGTGRRPQAHIMEAKRSIVGASTEAVLDEESNVVVDVEKVLKIRALQGVGKSHLDIVRVVARDLSYPLSRTIESYLIKFAYGLDNLTNRVAGAHAERFRMHGNWEDLLIERQSFEDYYVYALRDPDTGSNIYVGKGKKERIFSHFNAAREGREDADLGDKVVELRRLLERHDPSAIGRVLAHGLTEEDAFALECLTLKFLVGHEAATNAVRGHHAARFRARGDWQPRLGFDLPYVVHAGDGAQARKDEMDNLLGEGLADDLIGIAALVPEARFEGPVYIDSADLSMLCDVDCVGIPVGIKLFTRNKKGMQAEVRSLSGGSPKSAEKWMGEHCRALCYANRRKDAVFFPDAWHRKLAPHREEAARRVRLLRAWLFATSREDLIDRVGEDGANELLGINETLRGN